MFKIKLSLFVISLVSIIVLITSCFNPRQDVLPDDQHLLLNNTSPYTRWWWFASEIQKKDIKEQLDWLKEMHFGGVEIAFIYPVNRDPKALRVPWLSAEWTELVSYTKSYCDSIGFGCDFTFGTLWPFGGTFVADSDRTKIFGDSSFKQPLRLSWTHPDTGNVIDHLSKGAFERYSSIMGKALEPALKGSKSALFCDSWEVETKKIWTNGFGDRFSENYGYKIEPFMDHLYDDKNAGPRYDYMKLVADYVLNNFYIPFNKKCHDLNAYSRVQCAGSPTDIISAYASADIPETESMLYNPSYSRIVASAAALAGKPIVSAETFTCLYGWPANFIRQEQTADLKLVADALYANGTSHIIWHGTPFNPVGIDTIFFYASVHVGKTGNLSKDLSEFNQYLGKVAGYMRKGDTYTDIAVYIPQEDAWIAGEYPLEKQLPWAWGEYEMRYINFQTDLIGYQPLWINKNFLDQGIVKNNELIINNLVFKALYIDVEYMDIDALSIILKLAREGLPVFLKKAPKQAGYTANPEFEQQLIKLKESPNVSSGLSNLNLPKPLIMGKDIPEFWCKKTEKELLIFFSHPLASNLTYPLSYGQAYCDSVFKKDIIINYNNKNIPLTLLFNPYQSILISVKSDGEIIFEDIVYLPPVPIMQKETH